MNFTLVTLFWLGFLMPILLVLGVVPLLIFFAETTSTELVDEVYAVLGRYGRMSLLQITEKIRDDNNVKMSPNELEVHNAVFKLMMDGLVVPIKGNKVSDISNIEKLLPAPFGSADEILYERSGGTKQLNHQFSFLPT